TEPLSSISLPNKAPSRKIGKNWARNVAALPMKVWVQWASSGSPAKRAATMAASGASSSTLQPRKASQTTRPSPARMPTRPGRVIGSAFGQQQVDMGGRSRADIVRMGGEKLVRAAAALGLQHHEEVEFGIEFGRRTEFRQPVGHDPVRAHCRPARALAMSG